MKTELIEGVGDAGSLISLIKMLYGDTFSFSAIATEDGRILQLNIAQHYEETGDDNSKQATANG